jgi:hypothetical protein
MLRLSIVAEDGGGVDVDVLEEGVASWKFKLGLRGLGTRSA